MGVAIAGGLLYGAVKVSPFGTRATITIVVLVLAFAGMVIAGISGQALVPRPAPAAIIRYHRAPKRLALPERPEKRGLVLDAAPDLAGDERAPRRGSGRVEGALS